MLNKKTITENDLESIAMAKRKIKSSPPEVAINIVGPSGVGKSTMVKEVAEELGIPLLDVRAQQIESILKDLTTTYGKEGILLFDNFNLASEDDKKVCYQLILDRKVGRYELPEGWRIIVIGNHNDFVDPFGKALSNRFRHIRVSEPKTEEQRQDLYRWYYEHNVHPSIIAFLKFCPDAIFELPETTPRSWHMFSKQIMYSKSGLLDENGNLTKDKSLLLSECADYVGKKWAMQYANFVMDVFNNIPDPKTILEKGVQVALKNASMPTAKELNKLHILTTSVVFYLKEMYKQPGVIENFFDFVKEIKVPEFEILAVKEAWGIKELKEAIKTTPEFTQFCKKYFYMTV